MSLMELLNNTYIIDGPGVDKDGVMYQSRTPVEIITGWEIVARVERLRARRDLINAAIDGMLHAMEEAR